MEISAYQTIGPAIESNHFGSVFQGLEFAAQRDVRMIVAHERFATDAARWDRIWDDVLGMMKCQHQNLVAVFNVDKAQRTIITEWLPSDLQQAAANNTLSTGDVRQVIHQALAGLAEVHRRGFLHGDVRPANLQLTEDNFVKLGFSPGLAFGGEYHRRDLGNRFAAPELLNPSLGAIGPTVDLYGLGMSALYLLAGKGFDKKFRVAGKTPDELEQAWMHWQASPDEEVDVGSLVAGLPSDLQTVLHRLTRKKVHDRYPSAAEAQADLDTAESRPLETVAVAAATESPRAYPGNMAKPSGGTGTSGATTAKLPTGTSGNKKDSLMKAGILFVTLAFLAIILEPWTWIRKDVAPVATTTPNENPSVTVPPVEPVDPVEPVNPVEVVNPADAVDQAMGIEFVLIKQGTVTANVEGDPQTLIIDHDFYLATQEVTVAQFREFVTESGYQTLADEVGGRGFVDGKAVRDAALNWANPGFLAPHTGDLDDYPVVQVSWNDAQKFCEWLSEKNGRTYRLPTQLEWEYACRAGTSTTFSTGKQLDDSLANIDSVLQRAAPVGSYAANPWGLWDMHGNVEEWCGDTASADVRILCGGGWDDSPTRCAASQRRRQAPKYLSSKTGFRIVRQVE